jgi:hypothetical protein
VECGLKEAAVVLQYYAINKTARQARQGLGHMNRHHTRKMPPSRKSIRLRVSSRARADDCCFVTLQVTRCAGPKQYTKHSLPHSGVY